jgi:hypothetical protein
VEIPISVRFGSHSRNRLSSYIQAGLNTNIITQAIYDVKAEYRSIATALGSGNTQDDQFQLSSFRDEFSKFDKRRALIYAQGAVGAEWRANQNVNIYSQLTFGQQFLK